MLYSLELANKKNAAIANELARAKRHMNTTLEARWNERHQQYTRCPPAAGWRRRAAAG